MCRRKSLALNVFQGALRLLSRFEFAPTGTFLGAGEDTYYVVDAGSIQRKMGNAPELGDTPPRLARIKE
jgi:hypothetical protein